MPRLNKIDWLLATLTGPVTLFDDLPIMEEALDRFRRHDYIVHEFDCAQHPSQETLFNAVLHALGVLGADYTYENIQTIQFWDLLRYIEIPEESGIVLAFKNFDDYHRRLPESGQQMLSSVAREHFYELRYGLRLLTCVHSTDRSLELEPLLTISAQWNGVKVFSEEADTQLARYRKYEKARDEVQLWIRSHIPFETCFAFPAALWDVTGVISMDALLEMELNSAQMIELLKDYDFSKFKWDGGNRRRKQ